MNRRIAVSIDLNGTTFRVGTLWSRTKNHRESASFEYHSEWLASPERFALEPALSLGEGAFHTPNQFSLFGSMGDSAPDRWGRILMKRAYARKAKAQGETPRALFEIDYLLGVNDFSRQGALRFSEGEEGAFLSTDATSNIPPQVDLPKLLNASNQFMSSKEDDEDLKLLLAPGSSLGGARPKATVMDQQGNLCIAKFPRKDDSFQVVEWEAVGLTLAEKAGLRVPVWFLEKIGEAPVIILQKFDREGDIRIPFLSAMSMIGAADNEQRSYLEIAASLIEYGSRPSEDLEELWRRIIFTILISNTDDHMRNHGFLYEKQQGWRLSPLYDVNPTSQEEKPRILSTCIDYEDSTASLDTAMSVVKEFRIEKERAEEIVKEVAQAVSQWEGVAQSFGIKKRERERMSSAFCHSDMDKSLSM